MTNRTATTVAIILTLATASAPAASATANHAPGPPILPRVTASQLAGIEQADQQAPASAAATAAPYSDTEMNAYRVSATRHTAPGVAAVATPQAGFNWGQAGIGAAAGFALAILGLGGAIVISQRRTRRSRHTTALPS